MLNFEQALSDHSEKLCMYSGARIIWRWLQINIIFNVCILDSTIFKLNKRFKTLSHFISEAVEQALAIA